jgi:nucleotide-binding universal stress UspA family protein
MTSTSTSADGVRPGGATRVLLAVHGGEALDWGLAVRQALAICHATSVRILAVASVPRPSFTSLLPAAARRYRAARRAWLALEQERLQRQIDALTPLLPGIPDVTWINADHGDPGRAISEYAVTWRADLVLVGAAEAVGLWVGSVHERLIRRAPCPVLVTPLPVAPRRGVGVLASAAAPARDRRPVAAGQEA